MAGFETEQGAPAAPQQGGQEGGEDVMKRLGANLMQQAQALGQMAQVMGQAGAEGPAQKVGQAAQLLQAATEEMGISQGQQQQGPQAAPQTPEATAQPVRG